MAEQLRQERVRATTLASEVESLRRQLRQMEVKKGPTPAAAAPATKASNDAWVLEHFVEDRRIPPRSLDVQGLHQAADAG